MSSAKPSLVPAVFRRKSERKSGKQKTIGTKEVLYQGCLDETNRGVLEQVFQKYHEMGLKVSPDELNELHIFHTFISSHVKPNKIRDTPCMLLWAEWIRFFLKEMHTFPGLILEKEFRNLVINRFGFDVSEDDVLGQVYPGIQFVSQKNISLPVINQQSARA